MRNKSYWYQVDNAGKIFPAVSKSNRSNVFRLSFYIDEIVDEKILQIAVEQCLDRFETFAVQLKNGLFWNYLSDNVRPFKVEKESAEICKFFKFSKNNGYLFKVYYFENKITLETFHALTDGTGALTFLKSIVYKYFTLRGFNIDHENKILSELPYSKKESEDMFLKNYDKNNLKKLKEEPAYHLKGDEFKDNFSQLIKFSIDSKELLEYVKNKYNCTLTQYVVTLLAYSIYCESLNIKDSKKPIKLFVPANLRKYFSSVTLRNFSLYIKTTYACYQKEWTFDKMLKITKEEFKNQLNAEDLVKRINSNVSFEKNLILRIVPLFIKNLAFKVGYYFLGESINTCSISNLGIVDLPKDLEKKVLDVDFVNGGRGIVLTLVSVNNHTNIIFNTTLKDLTIINHFIKALSKEKLSIKVDSNYRGEYDEIL